MNRRHWIAVGLIALSIALLGSTFLRPSLQLEHPTYRYVFVFDISQSMNVKDVASAPNLTRLDAAKQRVSESLSQLPCGSQAGLALFTGHRAFLLIAPVEVCANYRELRIMLSNIDWRMTWESRSEVAKGVYKSIKLLTQLEAQTRLIFLSDGHEAPPINPELPPRFPGEPGLIGGLIVGVGGEKAVPIPKLDENDEQTGFWQATDVTHVDAFTASTRAREGKESNITGTEHLSSLRESYLQGVATTTGLDYWRLGSTNAFVRQLKSSKLGIMQTGMRDVRWIFALGALIALVGFYLVTGLVVEKAR